MALKTPASWNSCPCVAPPTLNRADMSNPRDAVEMMQCDLPGWVIKDTVASSLLSLASLTLGEATPRVVKTLKQPSGEVCVMSG